MIEYKNGYQYFYTRLLLIVCGVFIDELINIFNTILPQFLKDDKKYNQKVTCRTFENKYN